jgi:zinc/manganese transport system substrate-binding protein
MGGLLAGPQAPEKGYQVTRSHETTEDVRAVMPLHRAARRAGHRRRPTAIAPVASLSRVTAVAVGLALLATAGCSAVSSAAGSRPGIVTAIGAENEYANVISQIGGQYVAATAILSNPNADPHTFELSPSVAAAVSSAQLIVQNGVGYDSYMNNIEAAAPNRARKVIDVQRLLSLPDSTPNPHLWYSPTTMPAVARAISAALTALLPARAGYFAARLRAFDRSLQPWLRALAQLRTSHPGTPVTVTEPVGDYLLQAAGFRNLAPFGLQADIMNGVDPAPQYVALERNLLEHHKVTVFVYNQQVVDSLTRTFMQLAIDRGVPVVGVYETMPTGDDYQSWMLAETSALRRAIVGQISTQRL